ncbi:DUF3231 family protein [Heyndrickxia sp. NPDC080065]|uniref:DUF3231 family protein n=1 Tax=Heyndrickxia sp. NPDC080065 TaxID=3390568 RepID=UPI003D04D013
MKNFKPIQFNFLNKNSTKEKLTSAEMGKLWATYMGNSMSRNVLKYYLKHIEDQDIKNILELALNLSESFVSTIKEIFIAESFPIPVGITEDDVDLDAPRLFFDEFYLHYLKYAGKAGLSIYSIAIPLVTREDVRDFFIYCLNSTVKLLTEVNILLMEKGFLIKPAPIPIPEKVEFIKKQNFFKGFFGNIRPLHALEIAHLYDNIENDVTSKALIIGFSQVAKDKQVRQFFLRGKDITNKHVELCSEQLHKENLPSPIFLDHLVSTSTTTPFSDKLMLSHKIDMFSMKVRSYANALSLNGRLDLAGMYSKFLMDNGLYVEDGTNIMIEHGWFEKPPEAVDRDNLFE